MLEGNHVDEGYVNMNMCFLLIQIMNIHVISSNSISLHENLHTVKKHMLSLSTAPLKGLLFVSSYTEHKWNHEKNPSYLPLYLWLNRDPYNVHYIPHHHWVVFHPLYDKTTSDIC